MESDNPLVSIVVPAYNAEKYLKDNITSILGQTYKNLEVIYVCDGCTDSTVDILKEYVSDKRLKICIETENHGAAICRNIGMKLASGEWIIFFDSDDLFETNMIEEMVMFAVSENADLCCCYLEAFFGEPDRKSLVANGKRKLYCDSYPIVETERQLKHIMQLVDKGPCTKLVHESIYKKDEIFFQDLPNSNDVYYSMVCGMSAKKIVYVDKVLLHYRNDMGRKTLSTERNMKKPYILEAYDKIYEYIVLEEYKDDLLISFHNEIFACVFFYFDKPVIDFIIEQLNQKYLKKWEMLNSAEIYKELSYVNREIYKCILKADKHGCKEELILSARMEFTKIKSQEGCSIWGTGLVGSELLARLSQTGISISHVYDSAKEKVGKTVSGYLVEEFNGSKVQENIIITSGRFYEEIREQIGTGAKKVWNLEEEIWKIP